MAEETDEGSGASGPGASADSSALHIALDASSSEARDYLKKQGRVAEKQAALLDLQIENLTRQDEFETSHLRWRRFNDQMRGLLQMMAAAVAALVVAAIAGAVWGAYQDHGVVIEAFSVPPDLAAKGLTGEVIATQVQDRLAELQDQTFSYRAPSSYANNWGKDIKVQIPDTGVSIGEFNRYLAEWLGSETRITGEVYRTAEGLAITARAGSDQSPTFKGKEPDLDGLIEKAAESIYRSTQPYRYAIFLFQSGRLAEASAVLTNMIRGSSPEERAWAYIGLTSADEATFDFERADTDLRQSIALKPDMVLAWNDLASDESTLQHDEQALDAAKTTSALLEHGASATLNPYYAPVLTPLLKSALALALGDAQSVFKLDGVIEAMPDKNSWESAYANDIQGCGLAHDPECIRTTLRALVVSNNLSVQFNRMGSLALGFFALGHWHEAEAALDRTREISEHLHVPTTFLARVVDPFDALSKAQLGDVRGAHVLIDRTPLDCIICLRARGGIDAVKKNWSGADYWFSRAVKDAPSLPFAYTDWGQMLLAKGDNDGAILKFTIANQKGPHFADPLEMWGEALIAKNRSDLALAKFEEANKYAPHWGRLHLKWGEALWWSGDKDGAHKQFAIASGLDLFPNDKKELARVSHG